MKENKRKQLKSQPHPSPFLLFFFLTKSHLLTSEQRKQHDQNKTLIQIILFIIIRLTNTTASNLIKMKPGIDKGNRNKHMT